MIYNVMVILIGLLSSLFLFSHFPVLKGKAIGNPQYNISVVIPARNEEKNIKLLLQDLMKQTVKAYEIICVDDCSEDETYKVATSFNIDVLSIKDKPDDWTGKAWACQKGGEYATGDIILFLDADVRLSPNAISSLLNTYMDNKSVISVQPYHRIEKFYEQFSFFFNIIQIAANGVSIKGSYKSVGLYGPVILIDRQTYIAIDRHLSAKKSIVDDLALGEKLKQEGFLFKLFLGGEDFSFRMYGSNFKSLFLGWTKNYGTGAFKTPISLLIPVFLWVTSCISIVIILIQSIIDQNAIYILGSIFLYLLWVFELFRISYRIGKFKKIIVVAFPIVLTFFIFTFGVSFFRKLFHMNVVWKDRKIRT